MAFIAPFIPLITAGASAASGVIGFVGAQQAAAGAQANAAYSAAVARNQAFTNEQNAIRAEADAEEAYATAGNLGFAGQESARDQDFLAAGEIADTRVAHAGSGVTGRSQKLVIAALEEMAGRDRTRIRTEGDNQARQAIGQGEDFMAEAADLRTGAASARADAKMSIANGQRSAASARLSGISSLITGATGVGQTLLDMSPTQRKDLSSIWRRRATS